MRAIAAAITAHSMPFGNTSPTRALAHAARREPRRQRAALVVELGVGDRALGGDDRRLGAVRVAIPPQQAREA